MKQVIKVACFKADNERPRFSHEVTIEGNYKQTLEVVSFCFGLIDELLMTEHNNADASDHGGNEPGAVIYSDTHIYVITVNGKSIEGDF